MRNFNNHLKTSLKEFYKRAFQETDIINKEKVEILNRIASDIASQNFENFNAYNKIKDYELFDENYYLGQCEYKVDVDPLLHYIYYGYEKNLNPCEIFDTKFYKSFNENIPECANPLVYLVNHGIDEGIIKVNEDLWQPPSINKSHIDKIITEMNLYGINNNKRKIPLIISLTSYPKRINEVKYTIYSLLNQSVKPDKIVLWLSRKEFSKQEKSLPKELLDFMKYGLTIKWCDSTKSYKKLIHSIKEYPDSIIVTADDDLYYPEYWLEKLYMHHKKYPEEIVAHRCRKVTFNKDNVNKYVNWKILEEESDASFLNFFTTGGGVLFPPDSLSETINETEIYNQICPTGDDIWFWAMAVLNDTKIRVVKDNLHEITYVSPARDILFQKDTLWSYNEYHNDEQFQAILNKFPEIYHKIQKENYERQL